MTSLTEIHKAPTCGCVYIIENTITGDRYCGQTSNLAQRLYSHINCHSKNKSSSNKTRTNLYRDFELYGIGNFNWSVYIATECKEARLRIEKSLKQKEEYDKYSERERNRDVTKKHPMIRVMLVSEKKRLVFPSPMSVTNFFGTERTNILRALKGEYKYKRRFTATYITEEDYQKELGQLSIFQ